MGSGYCTCTFASTDCPVHNTPDEPKAVARHTKESLIAFEEKVKHAFLDKRCPGPVHLSGGNEDQLIEVFKDVKPNDWVFSTWRSHYHALLKGISEEWIFNECLAGRSMFLMNKEHRFLSSAIVGGILPIALGVAMGILRRDQEDGVPFDHDKVWVFVGDMSCRCGLFHEFLQYCDGYSLPVRIVIEDNGYSTNSRTVETWGGEWSGQPKNVQVTRYKYERIYPHVGTGQFVTF